jgi:hypothetical protein
MKLSAEKCKELVEHIDKLQAKADSAKDVMSIWNYIPFRSKFAAAKRLGDASR